MSTNSEKMRLMIAKFFKWFRDNVVSGMSNAITYGLAVCEWKSNP